MPRNGIGNAAVLNDVDVRMFLRDYDPEANYLIDDYEFTPEEISSAATFTVNKWNETPPDVAEYTVDTFPWRYHFLLGICAYLLRMAGFRYARNDLQYQVAGGAVADQAKAQSYQAMADRLSAEFDQWMRMKKSSIQAEIGWGAV